MKTFILVILVGLAPQGLSGQPKVVSDADGQRVFGGDERKVRIVLQNAGTEVREAEIRTRVYQASSGTAVLASEQPWKRLKFLPDQTVLESVGIAFPAVKAETRFVIQLIDRGDKVLGATQVWVYPTNLLAQVKSLAGEEPPGIYDPAELLKPLLRTSGVEYRDLAEDGTETFRGRLALFGPFSSRQQMPPRLSQTIRELAKRGVAVVWMLPPPERDAPLKPSFYAVVEGKGATVVAAHTMVDHLADSPEAQINLLKLAGQALAPLPLELPQLNP